MSNHVEHEQSKRTMLTDEPAPFPRLEALQVTNYRVLRNFQIEHITPLAAFVGANGSGKSTIFDVLSFLAECFTIGLRPAWEERGRFHELRSRGQRGPKKHITIKVTYREQPDVGQMDYYLAIGEDEQGPYVAGESLRPRGTQGSPILQYDQGIGYYTVDEASPDQDPRRFERFNARDVLAVSVLGQFARLPRVTTLYRFLTDWYLFRVTADTIRDGSGSGSSDRLTPAGDNLTQVIQNLQKNQPGRLTRIVDVLSRWVPLLTGVETEQSAEGRLLLQLRDRPSWRPILARFASEGALKMLAYLTILYSPHPPRLIGLEEPENFLHPRLLSELAEECRAASDRTQLLVTTHSPFFINGLRPEEVWVLTRDDAGFTRVQRAADTPGVPEFMAEGARLGDLWMEGYFQAIAPPVSNGATTSRV